MMRRFFQQPPWLIVTVLVTLAVLVIGGFWFAATFMDNGAAPGLADRNGFIFVCVMLMLRLAPTTTLKPTATKKIIDVAASLAVGLSVLWYLRTGVPAPLGQSAIFWYLGAYALGWVVGFIVERVRGMRTTTVAR